MEDCGLENIDAGVVSYGFNIAASVLSVIRIYVWVALSRTCLLMSTSDSIVSFTEWKMKSHMQKTDKPTPTHKDVLIKYVQLFVWFANTDNLEEVRAKQIIPSPDLLTLQGKFWW